MDAEPQSEPFKISDKEICGDTHLMMYLLDYTNPGQSGPEWKNRKEIKARFGQKGMLIVQRYNEQNKDKVIKTQYKPTIHSEPFFADKKRKKENKLRNHGNHRNHRNRS